MESSLIDRQAAIDALEKVAELFPWRVPGKSDTYDSYNEAWNDAIGRAEMEIKSLPSAQPDKEALDDAYAHGYTYAESKYRAMISDGDCISRQAAIDALGDEPEVWTGKDEYAMGLNNQWHYDRNAIKAVPSAQPERAKYEYHYDHTDCIWYRPEARNRCPTTCAQYRDGWNDAMNYIFRDGKGYRPFRRDRNYEE